MSSERADEFERMAEEFILEMSKVECPLEVFLSGLRVAISMIRQRISQVESELGE